MGNANNLIDSKRKYSCDSNISSTNPNFKEKIQVDLFRRFTNYKSPYQEKAMSGKKVHKSNLRLTLFNKHKIVLASNSIVGTVISEQLLKKTNLNFLITN